MHKPADAQKNSPTNFFHGHHNNEASIKAVVATCPCVSVEEYQIISCEMVAEGYYSYPK